MSRNIIAGFQKKAAVHASEDKAGGLLEPLLEADEGSNSSRSSDESSDYSAPSGTSTVAVRQSATDVMKAALVSLGLVVGAVASVGAIIISPAVEVFIMAGVCLAHAPYSAWKEFRITKLPALRSLNNALRQDVDKLEEQVTALSQQIEKLQPEADRATVVEEQLRDIATDQSRNVDKIIDLVKENESILTQTRENLRQRITQDMIRIVLMSDKNNDGRFSKVETKFLVLKISVQLQEYGVQFDESRFYKIMARDPSVTQMLTIVRRLVPSLGADDESEDDDDSEDLYDMFHVSSQTSLGKSPPGSPRSMPRSLSVRAKLK